MHGATATLTAAVNEGYAFAGWYENGQQRATSETLSFEVDRSREFIAQFNVIRKEPVILKHPQNVSIFVDEKATFYVEAQGTDDLKYFWQINRNDGNGFVDTACITKEVQLDNVPLHYDGCEFRCIVEDSNQKQVVSNAVKLNVRMPIESAPDVPKTGDGTPLMAKMALLMLSEWGICAIYINNRKQYR